MNKAAAILTPIVALALVAAGVTLLHGAPWAMAVVGAMIWADLTIASVIGRFYNGRR